VRAVQAHVWRVSLDADLVLPRPTSGERARADRFRDEDRRRQYLQSHAALRSILSRFTKSRLHFAVTPAGKPYLPGAPELRFNLSHSHEMALVGVAWEVEIGVDVERIRALSDYAAMAERFFPDAEAAAVTDERDFFRRWTRIEAVVKARGIGLQGIGDETRGEWTIAEIDAGPEYSAAVALPRAGIEIVQHEFGGSV
jgi:4'-phosphopantetheinyl transferase